VVDPATAEVDRIFTVTATNYTGYGPPPSKLDRLTTPTRRPDERAAEAA
jgi:hypothetical protein